MDCNQYRNLAKAAFKENFFKIPPEFEESGWKLKHNDNKYLCALYEGGLTIWMGNDIDEKRDMIEGAIEMHGKCLVLGLGIGLIIQYIDHLKICESITVVEKSPIVIRNIGPWIKEQISTPLEIIESDDEEFLKTTDRKFDTMYADTWEKCVDALEKIDRLKILAKSKVKGKKIYWNEKMFRYLKRNGRWR
jgi:hypothetical protein